MTLAPHGAPAPRPPDRKGRSPEEDAEELVGPATESAVAQHLANGVG